MTSLIFCVDDITFNFVERTEANKKSIPQRTWHYINLPMSLVSVYFAFRLITADELCFMAKVNPSTHIIDPISSHLLKNHHSLFMTFSLIFLSPDSPATTQKLHFYSIQVKRVLCSQSPSISSLSFF